MKSNVGNHNSARGRLILKLLYGISFLLIFYFSYTGSSFYMTPYSQRPRHDAYRDLRPAGNIGHAFGIIGSAMMLFMLLYSLRKRTRMFGKLGNLSYWLDIHIYFGVIGPLLVILHTSFKVQGLVAVSFWSMVAVASSGVFGRYLYRQIPRDIDGEQLTNVELDSMKNRLTEQISVDVKLNKEQLNKLDAELSAGSFENYGLAKSLWFLIISDLLRPFKRKKLKRKYMTELNLPPHLHDQVFDIFWEKSLLERRISFLNQVQTLFHYWHVFHKPFAVIMYLVMIVHVVVAVWLGYVWLF